MERRTTCRVDRVSKILLTDCKWRRELNFENKIEWSCSIEETGDDVVNISSCLDIVLLDVHILSSPSKYIPCPAQRPWLSCLSILCCTWSLRLFQTLIFFHAIWSVSCICCIYLQRHTTFASSTCLDYYYYYDYYCDYYYWLTCIFLDPKMLWMHGLAVNTAVSDWWIQL